MLTTLLDQKQEVDYDNDRSWLAQDSCFSLVTHCSLLGVQTSYSYQGGSLGSFLAVSGCTTVPDGV